jgi:flavin reductase (DIM6/NTAB) family NADH-FMN oxidoreductase RutF
MEKPYHLIYPMRVVLISSSHGGKDNVMTAAWCFPLSASPPMFGVSISRKRFTHPLIEASKEFVINIPGPELLDAARICGETSGRDKDKFLLAKLTKERSEKVNVPSIKECQASIECKVRDSKETGDHVVFIGEALNIKTRKEGDALVQAKDGRIAVYG